MLLMSASTVAGKDAKGSVSYIRKDLGFTLSYPGDYTLREMGSTITFTSPVQDSRFKFSPNVNVIVQPVSGETKPHDLFVSAKEGLKKLGDIKIIEEKKETLSGLESYRIMYVSRHKEANFKFLQYLVCGRTRTYVITYTALAEQFSAHQNQALAMMKSFKVVQKK